LKLAGNRNDHQAWLRFIRKAADLTAEYSIDELWHFRDLARIESPMFLRLIEAYIEIAEKSETGSSPSIRPSKRKRNGSQMHLFDLLREKTFFPQNLDLAQFASRVLPHMRTFRFDKMSRSDIAARIIEYLEGQTDLGTRDRLESSMREAMTEMKRRPVKQADRKSFLSKWERIIKGIEL
jgi:hypothetical protein